MGFTTPFRTHDKRGHWGYIVDYETAIHVGGVSQSATLDMPLALDGAGKPYLPGTSLAGPIRRWLERRLPKRDIEALWGFIPDRGETTVEGQASYVTIEDAYLLDEAVVAEIRDGVGIDRDSGTAAAHIKYDREVLPSGTRVKFAMAVDVPAEFQLREPVPGQREPKKPPRPVDDETVQDAVLAIVRALRSARIRFGAGKTRGLGRLRLEENFTITESDLATRHGILASLSAGPRASDLQTRLDGPGMQELLDGEIEIELHWRAVLPVMNKSDAEGLAVDALPLVTRRGRDVVPVITGASVKGVLRTQAERLCRTIAGCGQARWDQSFIAALGEEELVEALFGAPGKGRKDDERYAGRNAAAPGLGALSVDDCEIERPISAEQWRALASTTTKELKTRAVRDQLDDLSWKDFRPATHVAIDRWTGGAADALLFSRLEPDTDGERVFHLRLDLDRVVPRRDEHGREVIDISPDAYRRAAVALLLVTLRDVVNEKVPVGFGVTRGLGSIAVDRIVLRGAPGGLAEAAALTGERTLMAADFGTEPSATTKEFLMEFQEAWTSYWDLRGKRAA